MNIGEEFIRELEVERIEAIPATVPVPVPTPEPARQPEPVLAPAGR